MADTNPRLDFPSFVQENNIDLIVTLGDLERHDLLSLTQVTDVPKIGVYGNHCSGNYMQELGIRNMHMTTCSLGGFVFGGFQGCVRYKENLDAIMYTQDEATALFRQLPPVDILLCHCPPRGINDEDEIAHQGFDGEREYVDTFHPKVLLHGHTYPTGEALVRQHDETQIEYVRGYKIIEFGGAMVEQPTSFGAWLLELEKVLTERASASADGEVRLANLIDLESILDRSRILANDMRESEPDALRRLTILLDKVRNEINQYPEDVYQKEVRNQLSRKRLLTGRDIEV